MPYIEEGLVFKALTDVLAIGSNIAGTYNSTRNNGFISARNKGTYLTGTSILSATKDLILSFPVMCSSDITSETAFMITKAVERNCFVSIQMLVSASYLKGKDGRQIVKNIHTNLGGMPQMSGYMAVANMLSNSNYVASQVNGAKNILSKDITDIKTQYKVEEESAQRLKEMFIASIDRGYEETFNEASVNDYTIYKDNMKYTILKDVAVNEISQEEYNDAKLKLDQDSAEARSRIEAQNAASRKTNIKMQYKQMENQKAQQELQKAQQAQRKKEFEYQKERDIAADTQQELRNKQEKEKLNIQKMQLAMQKADSLAPKILDQDVKKANELLPSTLTIHYIVDDTDFDNPQVMSVVIGVKARLIPIPAEEIVAKISANNKTANSLLNFARATTGEIKFGRDYVQSLDQVLSDVKSDTSKKTNPIWRSLQARATKSKSKRILSKVNSAAAITSLVVSGEVVNRLAVDYGYDLNIPSIAMKLMSDYNFMEIIIVDEATEVARFLLDGETYYQDYAFSALQKELGDAGTTRKVVNLLSKVNR